MISRRDCEAIIKVLIESERAMENLQYKNLGQGAQTHAVGFVQELTDDIRSTDLPSNLSESFDLVFSCTFSCLWCS